MLSTPRAAPRLLPIPGVSGRGEMPGENGRGSAGKVDDDRQAEAGNGQHSNGSPEGENALLAALAAPAVPLSPAAAAAAAAAKAAGAGVVVDAGFSGCSVTPFFSGSALQAGIRRLGLGGKALTNLLKEAVSYRSLDMREEGLLVERLKESLAWVSQVRCTYGQGWVRGGQGRAGRRSWEGSCVS